MSNVTFDDAYSKDDYLAHIARNFTRRAPVYDEGQSGAHHRELLAALLSRYPPAYPVLDIACGTGLLPASLPDAGRGVTGVDLTPAMLAAAARNAPAATFVHGRAEALPLPDAAFASAYCCAALVYFTDIPAAFREAHRVLRPGGNFAYQAVTLASYVAGIALQTALVEALGEHRALQVFQLPHDVTDTREDNERLMRDAGFVDVKAELVVVRSELVVEAAEDWWGNLRDDDGNAMTARVRLLPPEEQEKVRRRYIAFLESRRNAENVIEEKIESWFVCGTKPAE